MVVGVELVPDDVPEVVVVSEPAEVSSEPLLDELLVPTLFVPPEHAENMMSDAAHIDTIVLIVFFMLFRLGHP